MDGTQRTTLITDHLTWPNSLTIDYPTNTLYWADAKLHIIESARIDGTNRRPVLTVGVLHPFGLTVFENRLYWSDWNTLSINAITKTTFGANFTENGVSAQEMVLSQNATDVETGLFYPTDLHVVHPALQPPCVNPCDMDNGGCEYMCLLSTGAGPAGSGGEEGAAAAAGGYACACPTGRRLMGDGRGCESE